MEKRKVAQKGPYVQKMKAGTYYFCACGHSKNQPFCDGSHKGTSVSPQAIDISEEKMVAWCGCKQSSNGAFCDGSHSKL